MPSTPSAMPLRPALASQLPRFHTQLRLTLVLAGLACMVGCRCQSDAEPPAAPAAAPVPPPPSPVAAPPAEPVQLPPPPVVSPRMVAAGEALTAYAETRAALANDALDRAKAHATTAAAKTRVAAATLPASLKPSLEAAAAAAESLAGATDIEAARLAFGELSRHWLTAIASEPALGQGLTAFQCPMAKGYQKWLQTGDEMANPFMGKRMLKCGGKVDLVP